MRKPRVYKNTRGNRIRICSRCNCKTLGYHPKYKYGWRNGLTMKQRKVIQEKLKLCGKCWASHIAKERMKRYHNLKGEKNDTNDAIGKKQGTV